MGSRELIRLPTMMEAVEIGLSAHRGAHGNQINVRSVDLVDRIVVVGFYPYATDPLGIKIESGEIIAFLSTSFDGDDSLGNFEITHFGARAYTNNNEEIMHVLSSLDCARNFRYGRSLEWILCSYFQDNTDETKLSSAKILISRIENGLRRVISRLLSNRDGQNWWQSIDSNIKGGAEGAYRNKFGNIPLPLGDVLIDYTYLRGLKKIIDDNWNDFSTILIDQTTFNNNMDTLNIIRRDEGHNRIIETNSFRELDRLYDDILGKLNNHNPGIIPEYQIEYWRKRLIGIFTDIKEGMLEISDEDKRSAKNVIGKFTANTNHIRDILTQLEGVVVPPGKEGLHDELIIIIRKYFESHKKMRDDLLKGDGKSLTKHNEEFQNHRNELKKYRAKFLLSEVG